MEANGKSVPMVTISHRGETTVCPASEWQAEADAMVRRLGAWEPGVSSVVPIETRTASPAAPAPAPLPMSDFGAGNQVHDDAAQARIETQYSALRSAGVEVGAERQLYATGTRLAASGYATQAARAQEHAEKMPARDAAAALIDAVRAERRRDVQVSAADFAARLTINGALRFDGMKVSEQAIRGMFTRLESPGLSYTLGLRDRLRPEYDATEEQRKADRAALLDVVQREARRFGDVPLQLRTREALGDVFAIVSPGYTPADAPDVLPDVLAALPQDARASFSYDPRSTAWELRASVFTPTPADEQAVGEAFEGYLAFSSRDNGTRRLGGGGGILLLRCLNASTYEAAGREVRRVHRGRVLVDLHAMAESAAEAIHALCAAWGVARADVLDAPALVPIEDVVPGFYRFMLTQRKGELVGVLPGRREERVKGLAMAFESERREARHIVRADLAQGWTRYVQDEASGVRRDAERAIGAWMVNGERVGYAAA